MRILKFPVPGRIIMLGIFICPALVHVSSKAAEKHAETTFKSKAEPIKGPLRPIELDGVNNAHWWGPKILSGSCPEGDSAFAALAKAGVKTIVTVDGAKPELQGAAKYGMRYVHIPLEYSGISREDGLKIARVVRDLPGPVFIHCHHGLHRGPAAAAMAAIATQDYSTEMALDALRASGTGANYKGLWADVRNFQKPTTTELNGADNKFSATAEVRGMVAAMIHMDARWGHLRQVKAAGWKTPAQHPDVDPAHEALLLKEAYHELNRSEAMKGYAPDFFQKMAAGEKAAAALEDALRGKDPEKSAAAYEAVRANCSSCHQVYRDNKAP